MCDNQQSHLFVVSKTTMIYAMLESSRENRNTSVSLWDEGFSVPGTVLQKKVSIPFILREDLDAGWVLGVGLRKH